MVELLPSRHVVAMPYPGRGHINPLLNLCRLILNAQPNAVVSFIITEEWLGFLSGWAPPPNFTFRTIPNVIPSEIGRAKDFPGFFEATATKLQAPVEQLLDRLQPPEPSVIIYDTYLSWVVPMGNRRNIPVASFYTMSATVFSILHHFDLILQNRHFLSNFSDEKEKEQIVIYIPGVQSMRLADLPTPVTGNGREVLPRALEAINLVPKAHFLLFASIYELESQVLDYLKEKLPLKVYSLGFSIPFFNTKENKDEEEKPKPEYMKWLDSQPEDSILYISQGSFLSVSGPQLEEIVAGVRDSGVRFLWVARGDEVERISGENGLVVPWCEQLKVLCHSSVGGFWSHCGWNSTKEGAFAGVPMLTFPIFMDQVTNSKMIVEDWKIGLRVRKDDEGFVTRDEVVGLVLRLMDMGSEEGKERRRRAREIGEICQKASRGGGSCENDVLAFVRDISGG